MTGRNGKNNRAQHLFEKSITNPNNVDVSELVTLLESEDPDERWNASAAIETVATDYPEKLQPVVPELIEYLTSEDNFDEEISIRRNIANAFVSINEMELVLSELFRKFNHEKQSVREEAARLAAYLAEERPEETVPELITGLNDGNKKIRENVAAVFTHLSDEQSSAVKPAIPVLISSLDDEHTPIRGRVALSLGYVSKEYPEKVKPAIPKITKLLDNEEIQSTVTYTFIQLAKVYPENVSASAPKLAELVEKKDGDVRYNAAAAIGHLVEVYPKEVIHVLIEILDSVEDDRPEEVINALGIAAEKRPEVCAEVFIDQINKGDKNIRREVAYVLGGAIARNNPETLHDAIPVLANFLNDEDKEFRSEIAGTLANLAKEYPDEVGDEVESFIPKLESLLEEENPRVQRNAVGVMAFVARKHPESVIPVLPSLSILPQQILGNPGETPLDYSEGSELPFPDASVSTAHPPQFKVGEGQTPGEIEKELLENIIQVVEYLTHNYPQESASTFIDQLAQESEKKTRRAAAMGLTPMSVTCAKEMKSVVPELVPFIHDDDDIVRSEVHTILASLADRHPESVKPAIPQLIEILDEEIEIILTSATATLKALAEEYPNEIKPAIPKVIELLDEERDEIRANAAGILATLGSEFPDEMEPAIPKLIPLLYNENAQFNAAGVLASLWDEYRREILPVYPEIESIIQEQEFDEEDQDYRLE